MTLILVPITLREAHAFVRQYHRHHRPSVGGKFAIGVARAESMVGAAIVGRPVARANDDGWTCEVTRVATDGTKNACSMLYGAAWRAARAMGYRRCITYTFPEEGGASLRGAGWRLIGATQHDGRGWSRNSRPRVDTHPLQRKLVWEAA